jgi:hypothetical protein
MEAAWSADGPEYPYYSAFRQDKHQRDSHEWGTARYGDPAIKDPSSGYPFLVGPDSRSSKARQHS